MRRRLFNIAAGISLLLFLAVCAVAVATCVMGRRFEFALSKDARFNHVAVDDLDFVFRIDQPTWLFDRTLHGQTIRVHLLGLIWADENYRTSDGGIGWRTVIVPHVWVLFVLALLPVGFIAVSPRVRRIVFTLSAAVCILLCVGTIVLWARSYWLCESVEREGWDGPTSISSSNGKFGFFESSIDYIVHPSSGGFPIYRFSSTVASDLDASLTATGQRAIQLFGFSFVHGADSPAAMVKTTVIIVPDWAMLAVLAAAPVLWVRSYRRRRRIARQGLCKNCGYDLTGNVSGVCPECGSNVSAATSSAAQDAVRGADPTT